MQAICCTIISKNQNSLQILWNSSSPYQTLFTLMMTTSLPLSKTMAIKIMKNNFFSLLEKFGTLLDDFQTAHQTKAHRVPTQSQTALSNIVAKNVSTFAKY